MLRNSSARRSCVPGNFWFLKTTNAPGGYGAGVQGDYSGCLQDRRDCKTSLAGKENSCQNEDAFR